MRNRLKAPNNHSMKLTDEGPLDVQMTDLLFYVATLATDGKWYVRAGFYSKPLAAAYAAGMAQAGVEAKIVWDDPEKS